MFRKLRSAFADPIARERLEGLAAQLDAARHALAHECAQTRLRVTEEADRTLGRFAHLEAEVVRLAGGGGAPAAAVAPTEGMTTVARKLIRGASAGALFAVEFNGHSLRLPRETLLTMIHCTHATADARVEVRVETEHSDWLRKHLSAGDTFADVGAATGAMTVPFAHAMPGLRVVAFEPNRTAARLLEAALAANPHADGVSVEVVQAAVSDAPGTAEFTEIVEDPTGNAPFWPETSTLVSPLTAPEVVASRYPVPVVTLDEFFGGRADGGRVRAAKIDVEGFEGHVLRGGLTFLARARPHLTIDIHRDPFGDGQATTDAACRGLLAPLGYTFERAGHVLLCVPPAA